MGDLGVLVALRGAVEEQLLRDVQTEPRLIVSRRCADAAEVLAAALAGIGDIAVVDSTLGVDRSFIVRLRNAGVVPIVYAPQEQTSVVENMAAHHLSPDITDVGGFLLRCTTEDPRPDPTLLDDDAAHAPNIIAIMSPWGSPGRTTVAVNLAAELAQRGGNPLLIDADLWGGAIKHYLGLDPDGAGIAAAVRAVERGTFDLAALNHLCVTAHGMHVLGGLNKADRWREISGPSLEGLWHTAATWGGYVVIDCPVYIPTAGQDHVVGFGPGPNAMWESIRDSAVEVCVVGGADTIGIHRLINFYLDQLVDSPHVVVNRMRERAAGPQPREAIEELLQRYSGITDPLMIPEDPAVDDAILTAQPLIAGAAKSPARMAIGCLADRFHPRRQRNRKRRGIASLWNNKEQE